MWNALNDTTVTAQLVLYISYQSKINRPWNGKSYGLFRCQEWVTKIFFFTYNKSYYLKSLFSPLHIHLLQYSNVAVYYNDSVCWGRIPNSSRSILVNLVSCVARGFDLDVNTLMNCSSICTRCSNVVTCCIEYCVHPLSLYILENVLTLVELFKSKYSQRCCARFIKFLRVKASLPWR